MRSKPNPACKWRHRKESQDQKMPKQKTAPGKVSIPSTASLDWNRKYPLPRRSRHLAKQRFSQPSKVLEGRTKTQTPQRDVACLIYGKHRDLFTSDIIRSASYLQGRATTKKLDTADSNKKHLDLFWCSHSETAIFPTRVGFTHCLVSNQDTIPQREKGLCFILESYMDWWISGNAIHWQLKQIRTANSHLQISLCQGFGA